MGVRSIAKIFNAVSMLWKGTKAAATATVAGAAIDGATGNNVTGAITPYLPGPVATALNAIHGTGKVAGDGVKTAAHLYESLGWAKDFVLPLGGLVASSLFMGDGLLKSVTQIACFAGLAYAAYKAADSAGWLPASFKNAVDNILPHDDPAPDPTKQAPVIGKTPGFTPS
jgi:hypothetical protein